MQSYTTLKNTYPPTPPPALIPPSPPASFQALELSRAQQDLLLAEKASVKLQAERDDLGKKVLRSKFKSVVA